ncbi:MAG: hypothetical protein LBG65_07675, partial [Puniceicoccales bacterium]|nr:hypothetical protein [Puniceicoccales bacterium]
CFQVDFWERVQANEKRLDLIPPWPPLFCLGSGAGFKEAGLETRATTAARRVALRHDVFQGIARIASLRYDEGNALRRAPRRGAQ